MCYTELSPCNTEKAPNAWQRRGTQKTRNTYNQPNWPNRKTSQTKHQALPKGQPRRRITPIKTAAVHASAQQPTISTHTRQLSGHHRPRVITDSSQSFLRVTKTPCNQPAIAQAQHRLTALLVRPLTAPHTRPLMTSALALQSQHRNANPTQDDHPTPAVEGIRHVH